MNYSLIFWVIGLGCLFALSILLWSRDQRSIKGVLVTACLLSAVVGAGIVVARSLPVTRTETVVKQTKWVKPPSVVYRDRTVYKSANDNDVAPVDVEAGCKGKYPVQIIKLDEQTSKDENDKNQTVTWISAHPLGSKIIIVCGQPGAFSDFWKVGDVVQFVRGDPQ